ncbi:MAG: hypothetical protein H0W83_13655 [Planctomycetes bacterium]|nr:hypothetical protein [Planctomycetota bacterium]
MVAVSPDSSAGEQGGAFYVVRLTIDHTALRGGEPVKLGMTGVTEIATNRDRLLRILANAATDTLTP